ncbi:hypothetical protein Aph02nite_35930 [Actinoplanes philippinensis]|uniref:Uncharacterized protein n=1 Tax=Actinoplanes philippinensis TaxID=35752 RepID=A0A1I2FE30_9ACTN|nr:DUF5682 family protein [Actinoplanes philippinensis]GIE77643.1 hypothetical protein Aph02nite_35930 [Actinoplanes philippinensis]SFF02830.1 hypothetical protein SAMN05421541_105283 [Actinoplanes philippinensis]
MPERIYGIRHHGPGSARAVLRELDAHPPEVLLIEGPPEADDLVRWAADDGLEPPVALLGYAVDDPGKAAFWPFAVFSPEWQAIRWAVRRGVRVRFFDLPYGCRVAPPADTSTPPEVATGNAVRTADPIVPPPADPGVPQPADPVASRPVDPIAELAAAAGYDDPERWWEDVVEHRGMPVFEAIAEAMAAIREHAPEDPDDLAREAYMRSVLREERRRHRDIAVVCGAWHVPALTRKVAVKDDTALLKGRRRGKVAFTWVPWTYGRLASWSGYGAGVHSPGWYHHLFTTGDDVVTRWLVDAAGVLRAEGVPTSSAHVIEAVRLAEALATLRGRPLAGLAEVTEAAEAVMCDGEPLRSELIARRLVVGERLGSVPDDMPAVPLVRDLTAQQRALRLRPEAAGRALDLDLRQDTDLRRSRLLHRLTVLGVPWGQRAAARRGTGTFREEWRLAWQPEFAVRLVEGGMWGTTVVSAATARVTRQARDASTLAEVTALVEVCLLADLAEAYPPVLAALDTRAALDADVHHLMAAIPALARTLRYGDVRRTDVAGLATVTASLLGRVCAALPSAAGSLSDEAARQLRDGMDGVHQAVGLLADDSLRERWLGTIGSLAARPGLHGLPAGRLTRLLLDAGRLDGPEVRRRLRLPLTVGAPPAHAAAWVEGFLSGGGLLLVHDEALLSLVDDWLADIPADAFDAVLPLLRRTFGGFDPGERRAIGERIAGGRAAQAGPVVALDIDRAATPLATLGALLGRHLTTTESSDSAADDNSHPPAGEHGHPASGENNRPAAGANDRPAAGEHDHSATAENNRPAAGEHDRPATGANNRPAADVNG